MSASANASPAARVAAVGRELRTREGRASALAALRGSDTGKAAGLAGAMIANNVLGLASTVVFAHELSDYGSLGALVSYLLILTVAGQAMQVATAREGVLGHLGRGHGLTATIRAWSRTMALVTGVVAIVSVLARQPIADAVGVGRYPWAAAIGLPAGCLYLEVSLLRGALQGVGDYRSVGLSLIGEQGSRLATGAVLAAGLGVTGAFLSSLLSYVAMSAYCALMLVRHASTAEASPRARPPVELAGALAGVARGASAKPEARSGGRGLGIVTAVELAAGAGEAVAAELPPDGEADQLLGGGPPPGAGGPEPPPGAGGPEPFPGAGGHGGSPPRGRAAISLWQHVKSAWAPIAALAVIAVLQNIDIIAAKHQFTPRTATSYAAVAVAAKVLVWIAIGAGFYLVPEVSRRRAEGLDTRSVLLKSLGIIFVCAVPVLLIFGGVGHLLIATVFGAGKASASDSLLILGLAFTVLSTTYLAIQYMLALKRTGFLIGVGLVALAEPALLLNASSRPASFAAVVLAIQAAAAAVAFTLALRRDRPASGRARSATV
jgi:O-antigen/teichoic acid export membrane protein